MDDEVSKLRRHLELLREEYVKLQGRLAAMEKKYQIASAAAGHRGPKDDENHFVAKLLQTVADLYQKSQYSDLEIKLAGDRSVPAHKFVLSARSDTWGVPDLSAAQSLDFTGSRAEVCEAMLRWVYADTIDVRSPDDTFLLDLLTVAHAYKLLPLAQQCEQALMSSVTVSNCISFYQTAETIGADSLRDHCSQLISSHWNDFTSEDFESMPASLAYAMFKSKSEYPLHTAVRTKREDVLFLYLVENDSKLPSALDAVDGRGDVALDLALQARQHDMAATLVKYGAAVNLRPQGDASLLHMAIARGDEFSAGFLIEHGADVNATAGTHRQTPLHLAASSTAGDMAATATQLLLHQANPNTQDAQGNTALHLAVASPKEGVLEVLLRESSLDVDIQNARGEAALWAALQQAPPFPDTSRAARLVARGAAVNAVNAVTGDSLLHMCARAGLEEGGVFLVSRGANPNVVTAQGETPLHTAAAQGLSSLANTLLHAGANPNAQTTAPDPRTPEEEEEVEVEIEIEEEVEVTASKASSNGDTMDTDSKAGVQNSDNPFASPTRPAVPQSLSLNNRISLNPFGDCDEEEEAETQVRSPFEENNPFAEPQSVQSLQSPQKTKTPSPESPVKRKVKRMVKQKRKVKKKAVFKETPLHKAIAKQHKNVVEVFLQYKAEVVGGNSSNLQVIPNFTLQDSRHQSVLALALWNGFHTIAKQLLQGGASVSETGEGGMALLLQAINRKDTDSALFLLNNNADANTRGGLENTTALRSAIRHELPGVVKRLCEKGANMNLIDPSDGKCPLWLALELGNEDIASILVQQGCERDCWGPGPGDCYHTLLHRAIDENNVPAACFLIRSQCDVNSPRRPSPSGGGGDEARDGQTPLHQASTWGQDTVVQTLLEFGADVNTQDAEGKTPLHVAIENQHDVIISLVLSHPGINLCLRDNAGRTVFAAAMATRNNKAAQAILEREPGAAEQFDSRGRTFLHAAVGRGDVESVLFLISVHVHVNTPTADAARLTPIHLATAAGNEFIVRNLILAGAHVDVVTPQKQTCLHLAAEKDHAAIVSLLLENHAQFDKVDDSLNNALHIACQQGHLATARVLLTESQINAEAVNIKGQNPMHCLGQYGKESAAAIYDLFMECMPDFPIDKPDANGNTVLLLAYFQGNGNLCRAVVRSGAALGAVNKDGVSIFNAPVATKQLLFKLLDMLSAEPPWTEGETCLECGCKFGIRTRKHHCRHCGRLLCAKCSGKDMPIIKYNITAPTRVCDVCFDVLTHGTS